MIPIELEPVKNHYVWAVFEIDSNTHKKQPIMLTTGFRQSCTEEHTLFTYDQATKYTQDHGGVLAVSLPLASEILKRTLYVIDLDCDKPEFDRSRLDIYLGQETFVDISPSGKGYHLWYSFNRKPTRPTKIAAVDHITGFITLSGNVYKNAPIQQIDLPAVAFDNGHHQPLEQYLDIRLKTLSPIRAFNEQCEYIPGFSPRDLLAKHGYIQYRGGRKFLYPHSQTGAPGVAFYPAHKGSWEVLWSFHQDDPLAGLPRDPFDVFRILECSGDLPLAIMKASEICKPVDYEDNKILLDTSLNQYNKLMRADKQGAKVSSTEEKGIPAFPKDWMSTLPEPWPSIWSNWKQFPRVLDEALLMPTVLAAHAHLLNSKYVNAHGRRPNTMALTIAPSTAGKDDNSRDVLLNIIDSLTAQGSTNLFFQNLIGKNVSSITADTSFLESFIDNSLFWINTEATTLFQQLANNGNSGNSSVKAVADKLIEMVDGKRISGKQKSGELKGEIEDPNCQAIFFCQPETVASYLKANVVDSGLLGRANIYFPSKEVDPYSTMFSSIEETKSKALHPELMKLYSAFIKSESTKIPLVPTAEDIGKLQAWAMTLKTREDEDDRTTKMIVRLGIATEQLYTIVLGVVREWNIINNQQVCESIDIDLLMPLLDYWEKCRRFAIKEFINDSVDPLAEGILDLARKLISGEITPQKYYASDIKKHQAVPLAEINRALKSRKKLLRELEATGDMKNIRIRVNSLLKVFIAEGELVEVNTGKKNMWYGFPL